LVAQQRPAWAAGWLFFCTFSNLSPESVHFRPGSLNLRGISKLLLQVLQAKSGTSGVLGVHNMNTITRFIANEDGATAIEYGLIAALIAVAAVTVMGTVGTRLSTTFNTVATKL
jgi:pilus assembly protein Flp/PilA